MMTKSRYQKGITAIEMIVSVFIISIIGIGVTTFLTQTISESHRSHNNMQAIMQVENVGFWVSRDVQMAENITMGPSAGFPLQLNWIDFDENNYQVTYSLTGGQIKRSFVKNGQELSQILIAESINSDPALTSCIFTDNLFTFNVTATLDNNNVSRTYQIKKRLELFL